MAVLLEIVIPSLLLEELEVCLESCTGREGGEKREKEIDKERESGIRNLPPMSGYILEA